MSVVAAEIDILLGVYNGAEYLEETLESVYNQDFQNWRLWVRDDGSADATPAILHRWQERLGARMVIYPNPDQINLGIYGNFSALLAACTAPYVTAAAHDDLYHPGKLSLTLAAMKSREVEAGSGRPIVVYTDQRVIDGKGRLIAPSLWRLTGWKPPASRPFATLLVHSAVYGGTTLINRAMIGLLGTPPRCDDTWFAWLGAVFGELVPLHAQTVDFRRHGQNFSELTSMRTALRRLAAAPWRASRVLHERLEEVRPQAKLFLEHYHDRLPPEQLAAVKAFLRLPEMGFFARRWAILRYGLLYPSWLRMAGMVILI